MRKITEVIDRIVSVVPGGNDLLLERLAALRVSASLAAPEMQSEWWDILYETLVAEIGEADKAWKEHVREIFSGEDDGVDFIYGVSAVTKAAPTVIKLMAVERYIEERKEEGR